MGILYAMAPVWPYCKGKRCLRNIASTKDNTKLDSSGSLFFTINEWNHKPSERRWDIICFSNFHIRFVDLHIYDRVMVVWRSYHLYKIPVINLPYVRILRSYHFVHIFCVSYLYVLMHILCVCIFYHFNERPLSTVLYALFLCLWWKVSNDLNKRLKLDKPHSVEVMFRVTINIASLISNYTHYNVWDEITYPFLNFNGATVEV